MEYRQFYSCCDSGTQANGAATISDVHRERGALGKSSCQQLHVLSRSYTCTPSHIPLVRTWHPNSWGPGSMILPGPWERESQQQCRAVFLTTAKIYHCASRPFNGRGNMTLNLQLVFGCYRQNGNAFVRVVLCILVVLQMQLLEGQQILVSWL